MDITSRPIGFGIAGAALAPLVLVTTGAAHAEPRMRTPMTYIIDYSRRYLDDDRTIEALHTAPPTLMHVGKSVPILHNWGPVPLISGENQYTGGPGHTLKWEAIRLLTPAEVSERIERLKQYTGKWHEAGIPQLLPYSSYHTIAGDHEKREGFWQFYDHWDDYAQWLGPKPDSDPFEWLMVDKSGTFVPGACGGYSPKYYAPLHRYRVCPENPNWQAFQQRLTTLIAEVGYDGVFPDNSNPTDTCFCPYCREGFRHFVANLPAFELDVLGDVPARSRLDLMSPDTPAELIRRYRIDTSCRYQQMVRAAGRRVQPGFIVFPNVNSYSTFMPLSFACDVLMFESTYSPGCSFVGEPPPEPYVTIEVANTAVAGKRQTFQLEIQDSQTFVELAAEITYPAVVQAGQTTRLEVLCQSLGASNTDGDWAENFAVVLIEERTKEETRLPLEPRITIGGGALRPDAKRPPQELSATWTPEHAGRYRLCLAYSYTDEQHLDATRRRACQHDLPLGLIYRTHIGQLLFTMHAGARTVLLDYECLRTGKEAVQELALAECAAFSSGSTIAAKGQPREKYAAFFEKSRNLYDGAVPYADIGLLYGYWGYNPANLGLRPNREVTPSIDLCSQHRPVKVLMDRTLSAEDLQSVKALILCGSRLELRPAQIAAVRRFAARGGKLYVYREATTVNSGSLEALGDVTPWEPGMAVPGNAPLIEPDGPARGLRFSLFTKPEKRRIILHTVNYSVAYAEKPALVTEVKDTQIRVPVPDGWTARSVLAHAPDEPDTSSVPFKNGPGHITLTLDNVRIYNVLDIACE